MPMSKNKTSGKRIGKRSLENMFIPSLGPFHTKRKGEQERKNRRINYKHQRKLSLLLPLSLEVNRPLGSVHRERVMKVTEQLTLHSACFSLDQMANLISVAIH